MTGSVLAACETGTVPFIEQYGNTWTFDAEYECGQFVNGDYYLIPDDDNNVVVTEISPAAKGCNSVNH